MNHATWLCGALLLDLLIGWPDRWYRGIGHPVSWIGHLIDALDRRWNDRRAVRSTRIALGTLATCLVVLIAAGIGGVLQTASPAGPSGTVVAAIVAWPALAARSLHEHVAAVAEPLAAGDLAAARLAVASIVGRDPDRLDAAGIARASLESLAENASDAVVAPVCWGLVLGLPGLFAYKAINTLDSMIGHRSDRHEAFGKAAARLDDVANWIPARLTALLFAIVSGRFASVLCSTLGNAQRHRSPNAGWPESAVASALDVRLSGPRHYPEGPTDEPYLNERARDPNATDVMRALRLYRQAGWLLLGALGGLALLL